MGPPAKIKSNSAVVGLPHTIRIVCQWTGTSGREEPWIKPVVSTARTISTLIVKIKHQRPSQVWGPPSTRVLPNDFSSSNTRASRNRSRIKLRSRYRQGCRSSRDSYQTLNPQKIKVSDEHNNRQMNFIMVFILGRWHSIIFVDVNGTGDGANKQGSRRTELPQRINDNSSGNTSED